MDDKDSIDYYLDIPIDETGSVDSFTELASAVKGQFGQVDRMMPTV
jgi:hypothetical protein